MEIASCNCARRSAVVNHTFCLPSIMRSTVVPRCWPIGRSAKRVVHRGGPARSVHGRASQRFHRPTARAKRIDERLAREYPHLSGVHPARRLATAILMYSFGGATRAGESEGEVMGIGVTEPELLSAVVSPDLDSLTAQATLKELREQCLYLHFDGSRYVFKTTPNVTQLLEDEAENNVHAPEVRTALKENLQGHLAGRLGAIVWPEKSSDIPDKEPHFLLAYLPLEFAQQGDAKQREIALDYFTRCGNDLRKYRNGLGLAIPDVNQIQTLYRAERYLKAVGQLRLKRKQLNITQEQLKEREDTEKGILESSMRNLYLTILLPQMTIEVMVNAQSLKGFDPVWLRNAVLEPLVEADVQVEKEGL